MFTHIMLISTCLVCRNHMSILAANMHKLPHIHILMCTKDGEAWLADQLSSILTQSHSDWSLWISDDGSRDATLGIISAFISGNPERDIRLFRGPQRGCAQNFLSLLARPELTSPWVAFADQDDIWMPHKLQRSIEMIRRGTGAQIYASRCVYINAKGNTGGVSPQYHRPYGFGNALVQNILRGNTLVMPPVISGYLQSVFSLTREFDLPFHDWCIYLAVTGAGFDIIHDEKPGLFYRQHSNNLLGACRSNALRRARLIYKHQFSDWLDRNIYFLTIISPFITQSNQSLLNRFIELRKNEDVCFLRRPQSLGIHRQTLAGDFILQAMSWCRKL